MAAAHEFKKSEKIAYSKVVESMGGPTFNSANTMWIFDPRDEEMLKSTEAC